MPELLLIPHSIVPVTFKHWQVFKHQQAGSPGGQAWRPPFESASETMAVNITSVTAPWWYKKTHSINIKIGKTSCRLTCLSQSSQNYQMQHIQDKYNTIK